MTENELNLKEEVTELKRMLAEAMGRIEELEHGDSSGGIYLDGVQQSYRYEILKELGKGKEVNNGR